MISAVCVKRDFCDVAFRHFEIARSFCDGGVHRADLTASAFAKVLESRADDKSAFGECGLRSAIDDLKEQFTHSGVDSVAHEVCVESFENGLARENLGSHSR